MRRSSLLILSLILGMTVPTSAQQNPTPPVIIAPSPPNIVQPQNGLPVVKIPNFASQPACGPGSANPKTLAKIAAKLRFSMRNDEIAALQANVDRLAKKTCPDDRLAAYFLNLLALDVFAIERAR